MSLVNISLSFERVSSKKAKYFRDTEELCTSQRRPSYLDKALKEVAAQRRVKDRQESVFGDTVRRVTSKQKAQYAFVGHSRLEHFDMQRCYTELNASEEEVIVDLVRTEASNTRRW